MLMRSHIIIFSAFLVALFGYTENTSSADVNFETEKTCSLEHVWDDKRSGADLDGFFYLPYVESPEYIIGGFGTQEKNLSPTDCVLTVSGADLLIAPFDWEMVWKDKGSGAKLDGSMWRAIPPDDDYRCIGHIPQLGYDKPNITNYRCVHASLTEKIITSDLIWSDKGSGSDKKVSMFRLPNSQSFVTVDARLSQYEAYDLALGQPAGTGGATAIQASGSAAESSGAVIVQASGSAAESSGAVTVQAGDMDATTSPESVSEAGDTSSDTGDASVTQPIDREPEAIQTTRDATQTIATNQDETGVVEQETTPVDNVVVAPGLTADVFAPLEKILETLAGNMVVIPVGAYRMGDLNDKGEIDESPVRTVNIRPFRLGKHEVTFDQWDACVADGGCNGYRPNDAGWGRGDRPVIYVSWDDVHSFIDWLNSKTAGKYRLPSEAEWEYAARAGTTTDYSWGDSIGTGQAACDGCGSPFDAQRTAPVGSFSPNNFGLHEMHDNVGEWVEDCWHENYQGAPDDGSAWTTGGNCNYRVVRGGSWLDVPSGLRASNRFRDRNSIQDSTLGFRLAQDI